MGEAGGPTKVMWRLQSAFLWRLDTVSLGKHQRNGVERQGKVTTTTQRNGAHVESPDKHQPPAKVGRGTSRPPRQQRSREWWSRRGKKALFFGGSTPFLWASTKEMGSKGRTGQRPPPNVTAHTYKAQVTTRLHHKKSGPRRGPLLLYIPPRREGQFLRQVEGRKRISMG